MLSAQNPRYLEITGILVAGIGLFFLGPPKFIGEPYVWRINKKLRCTNKSNNVLRCRDSRSAKSRETR